MNSNSHLSILGIRVDNLTRTQVIQKINNQLLKKEGGSLYHVTTLNPEIILKAYYNRSYRMKLNSAELNIVDGIGLKFALLYNGAQLKYRFSGTDLMWEILKIAQKNNYQVFLLTNKRGLTRWREVQKCILNKIPNIKISGSDVDPLICFGNSKYFKDVLNKINNADIVFVNFGAPEQEIFLHNIKNKTSAKVGIGVGGAFDFIANKKKRAPKIMRQLGLEWLFRLLLQPSRFRRIFNAVILFPFKVITFKKN